MIGGQKGLMDQTSLTPENMGLLVLGMAAGLMVLNLATFTVFAMDKQREMNGREPLPEVLLLSLVALGGWPAAKLAQLVLRFQEQTAQFRSLLNLVALPLVAVAAIVTFQTVDLWAVEARVMSYIGEMTGTGPEFAAKADETQKGPQRIGPTSRTKAGKTLTVAPKQ